MISISGIKYLYDGLRTSGETFECRALGVRCDTFLTEACLFEVSCQNQIEAIRVGVVQLLLLYKDGDYGLESCSVAYL